MNTKQQRTVCFISFVLWIVLAVLSANAADMYVYFGTHRSGPGIGFSLAHFDTDTGALTKPEFIMEAVEPAFFVIHPDGKHLYTCNSGKTTGAVSAYEISPKTGRLTLLNQKPSGGPDPSYITLDKTGRYALVANYQGGNIAVLTIDPDHSLGEKTGFAQHTGSSVDPIRQTKPYAHSIIVDPGNRFALVADLGLDKVFVYRFNERDGSLAPNDPPFATVKPGSGPRHVKFHPNGKWVYVINEMGCTVTGFKWNAVKGSLTEFQTISTLPEGFTGTNTCAELVIHPNGRFLYGSNRGHDSIAVFAIDQKTGKLTLVERVSSQGKWPRNFTFDPTGKWILCSNHNSDNAVVFRVDGTTGKLTQVGQPVEVPFPFCERFLPVPFQSPASSDGPDPREIPVPSIKTTLGTLPGVNDLPAQPAMPDVMLMSNGQKVTTVEQWKSRREDMKRILQYYAVGLMPPSPGNVKGHEVKSQTVLDGKVKYQLVRLTFGPGEKLELNIGIFTPTDSKGPFPAVIMPGGTPPGATPLPALAHPPGQGHGVDALLPVVPATESTNDSPRSVNSTNSPAGRRGGGSRGPADAETIAKRNQELFRRGYAYVMFNNNDCAEDTTLRNADGSWAFRNTRFYPAYPGYDWGVLAGWAWGVSRIVDYLETDPSVDKTKLIVSGVSRTGKSAMIAAAFDDRLAMAAPCVTGGGGIGAYRFAGPHDSETMDIMMKKYPNWFSPHLHEFWGQREKLPFDEHWFLALCAPRPFIALEGDTDTISLPDAVKQSVLGAKPAYALFDATDRLGVNYGNHGHAFTEEDATAMLDFADKYLRGMKVERRFDQFPP